MQHRRHQDRIVLVNGGAAGIGAATARAFAAEGARLVIADIDGDAASALARELGDGGSAARWLRIDATREADAERAVAFAVAEFGRLDVAINNVGNVPEGYSHGGEAHELSFEAWRGTLDLNLSSCFLGMKHQVRQMLAQGGGVIGNTASMAGVRVVPETTAAYTAAKAGIVHLTRYMAVTYADRNIRVNAIAPGFTRTRQVTTTMTDAELDAAAALVHPAGRVMEPEDQAAAFVWLCSDAASGITGLTVPVSGGWAAG